jgi:hypothetical protein
MSKVNCSPKSHFRGAIAPLSTKGLRSSSLQLKWVKSYPQKYPKKSLRSNPNFSQSHKECNGLG